MAHNIVPGQRFGRLVVVSEADPVLRTYPGRTRRIRRVRCACDCGAERIVRLSNLLAKNGTRSCGCLIADLAHGRRKHGGAAEIGGRMPEYRIWSAMINRCTNPNDHLYRPGVRVCKRWRSFELFLADVGRRPDKALMLRRINQRAGYRPGNVAWLPRSVTA